MGIKERSKSLDERSEEYVKQTELDPNTYKGDVATAYTCGALEEVRRLQFNIWSNEHNAWWAPHKSGYVEHRSQAGVYSYDEATVICEKANIPCEDGDPPQETMLPVT